MNTRPHLPVSPPRGLRGRRRPFRATWPTVGVCLVLALAAAPLFAPSGTTEVAALAPQSQEDQARNRYQQAKDAFQELQREALELEPSVIRLSSTLERYRGMGNQRALEDAFINDYLPQAFRLQNLSIQSEAARSTLDEARRDLLRVLRLSEEGLLSELEQGPPAARLATINARVVAIRLEVSQLEREREPLAEVGFRPVPRLAAAPTDGPQELRAKAGFLERTAETFASQVEFLDEEIRVREGQLRLQRGFSDARDAIGRFDGDRPVGTGPAGRTGGAGQAADERAGDAGGTLVVFSELPLPEQIERLRSVRIQAVEARDESLSRAAELRRLAVVRGGGGE
jgi:hypothetical protein